jgi:hypothetical protein
METSQEQIGRSKDSTAILSAIGECHLTRVL